MVNDVTVNDGDGNGLLRCSECGQVIAPDPATVLHLTIQERIIYDAVRAWPRSTDQLYEILYAYSDSNALVKIVHVLVHKLNRKLAGHGKRIVSRHRQYVLEDAYEKTA